MCKTVGAPLPASPASDRNVRHSRLAEPDPVVAFIQAART